MSTSIDGFHIYLKDNKYPQILGNFSQLHSNFKTPGRCP